MICCGPIQMIAVAGVSLHEEQVILSAKILQSNSIILMDSIWLHAPISLSWKATIGARFASTLLELYHAFPPLLQRR